MTNSSLDPALGSQQALFEETLKTWNRFIDLPRILEQAQHVRVGTTPSTIVHEENTLKLLRYQNEGRITIQEPVFFCYALVNRPYILDLQPRRSVVQHFLKRGFDVFLIDWGVPTAADSRLGLEDYLCGLMKNSMEVACRLAGSSRINLLGYCMGGTMAALFTALFPEMVQTLTLMAAPIDFVADESLLRVWAQEQYFDVDRFIEAFGNCPAAFLQSVFQLLKPVQNCYLKYCNLLEHLEDEDFLENFLSMERWTQDTIPVAGATFREFVKALYRQNQLVRGEFQLRGQAVRLDRITCPLALLTAKHDHLVTPGATLGILPHVGSSDIKSLMIDTGHVGLAVSSRAQGQLWPEIARWIAERSTPLATQSPPSLGDGSSNVLPR